MNPSDYEITNGYVGSFGKIYKTATEQTLAEAIKAAAELNGRPVGEIQRRLEGGSAVNWCQSPNYYYDHSHGVIRRKRSAKPVDMKLCDCGHRVPSDQVMSASLGTSCPDCYDRMSG